MIDWLGLDGRIEHVIATLAAAPDERLLGELEPELCRVQSQRNYLHHPELLTPPAPG